MWGIPLATSLVNIAGTAALLSCFRRRLGRIEFGETAATVVRDHGRLGGRSRRSPIRVWRGLDEALGRSLGGADRRRSARALVAGLGVYLVFLPFAGSS